jgi:hypothetical protein
VCLDFDFYHSHAPVNALLIRAKTYRHFQSLSAIGSAGKQQQLCVPATTPIAR